MQAATPINLSQRYPRCVDDPTNHQPAPTGRHTGYGDLVPVTEEGKLAAALYALVAVNVVGGLLEPAKAFLSGLVESDSAIMKEKSV